MLRFDNISFVSKSEAMFFSVINLENLFHVTSKAFSCKNNSKHFSFYNEISATPRILHNIFTYF
jgi:hypothetical protein